MTLGSVVIGIKNLSPLGTKYAFIALFGGMSISRLRICPNRRHGLSRRVEISFSLHFFNTEIYLFSLGI